MDEPICGDHYILGGTTSTFIGCNLVVVIYETTAMMSSEIMILVLGTDSKVSNELRNINPVGRGSRNITT